jgi:hypothetical protein
LLRFVRFGHGGVRGGSLYMCRADNQLVGVRLRREDHIGIAYAAALPT